ncbi:MAG: hypothetical protein V7K67_13125 [Nostoc sp.]
MLNIPNQDLRRKAIQFLEQSPPQRLQVLKQMGIARYHFLTKLKKNSEVRIQERSRRRSASGQQS